MKFAKLFGEWYEHYARTVTPKTAKAMKTYFDRHLPKSFLNANIKSIKPKQLLDLSNQVAKSSTFYAKRLIADIIRIYDYAVIMGYLEYNPMVRISKYTIKHQAKGLKYVDLTKIKPMLRALHKQTRQEKAVDVCFWLIVYTAVRRAEATQALKSEFDFDKNIWTIPADRMKIRSNGEHLVFLAPQIAKMLQDFFATNTSNYAFPSDKTGTHIATWSPYYLLKKTGYSGKQTLHGFRKIFSTHAHESGLWTIDAIELSLSHKIGGVRGVYNHAKMSDERRKLMAWYADEIDKWRYNKSNFIKSEK
ncbi:tyrosine-type recombinase/integrase [Moraxella boevrei]|uniref:tyrosine-type recombinase/integrase n=1 Tax=Faucicola boevrei TaxID=346665 RepID=UPI0037353CB5